MKEYVFSDQLIYFKGWIFGFVGDAQNMKKNKKHYGGCGCGFFRYETIGNPTRAGICHCRYCQTRTGSAFGISVYFEENQVSVLNGELTEYEFKNSSGRKFKNRFCRTCGTTVFWEVEIRKGLIGIAGGTFDPPTFWFEAGFEVFCRSKAPFIETNIADKKETTDYYEPIIADNEALTG